MEMSILVPSRMCQSNAVGRGAAKDDTMQSGIKALERLRGEVSLVQRLPRMFCDQASVALSGGDGAQVLWPARNGNDGFVEDGMAQTCDYPSRSVPRIQAQSPVRLCKANAMPWRFRKHQSVTICRQHGNDNASHGRAVIHNQMKETQ